MKSADNIGSAKLSRRGSFSLHTHVICPLGLFLLVSGSYAQQTPGQLAGGSGAEPDKLADLSHTGCDSFTIATARPLSFSQKSCYWGSQLFTGSAVFGAAFFGAIAMAEHTPKEWPQGAQGFGYQFGTRYTQGMVKSTTTFLVGAIAREDPRPKPPNNGCAKPHYPHYDLGARLGASLLRVVWTQHDESCADTLAVSRIAGSLASGFVQRAYLPPSTNTLRNAWLGSASALGGYAANSVWTEFQGDVFRWLGKVFPTGKPK